MQDLVSMGTSDWHASLHKTASGPASFHVSGIVQLPTPGHEARFVKAVPQGFNPRELILELQVTPRPGVWPQVMTPASLRYDEDAAAVEYTGVLVRKPDGDAVHFAVDVVR
jgi:hypothetical protein